MDVTKVEFDRKEARELYRAYKKHQHYSAPMDHEIRRTYQLIAQGRVIIKALESIRNAGLNEQELPKLAIMRADVEICFCSTRQNGSVRFSAVSDWWGTNHWRRHHVDLSSGSFTFSRTRERWQQAQAQVPLVPIHVRPKRGLANYHILWEAEWEPVPPRDPMLLRRIGKADLWLVVAAWDLTEIERTVLAGRLNG